MARGWESKNVEEQQAENTRDAEAARRKPLTADERQRVDRRRGLELARARAASGLETASNPAHRTMLEQTLSAIDEQLTSLANEGAARPARA